MLAFLDANIYQFLLTLHLLGLALGIGGATITDFTFLRALKEGRITEETVNRLRVLSQVVWVGLGVLALSGLGLFLLGPDYFLASTGFLAKMAVVLVITVNGLFLNFYTTSRLTKFTFTEKYPQGSPLGRARRLSFLFGSISLVSWYSAFFLAMLKSVFQLPFFTYIVIYLVVLTAAIVTGQLVEHSLTRKNQTPPQPNTPPTSSTLTPQSQLPPPTVAQPTQITPPTSNAPIDQSLSSHS